ncbi:hypothetical protein CALCODRAFT_234045 [Calocera cornea HHB12733]|uniref:Uncharacterized protein n=1 Tax=Calocera cornea HHB12733 TaxID=1353952 RepID=A0A165GXB5_9BASI|nr:hypothetical protein CALCODRAFT_234045 [Calocera cornea HHB12733]
MHAFGVGRRWKSPARSRRASDQRESRVLWSCTGIHLVTGVSRVNLRAERRYALEPAVAFGAFGAPCPPAARRGVTNPPIVRPARGGTFCLSRAPLAGANRADAVPCGICPRVALRRGSGPGGAHVVGNPQVAPGPHSSRRRRPRYAASGGLHNTPAPRTHARPPPDSSDRHSERPSNRR